MNEKVGTFNWTRQLLASYGLNPKKHLGQNFLIDRNVLAKIIEAAGISARDLVVEIGTGLGALTLELAASGAQVVTIEVDKTLNDIHREVFAAFPNITKIEADVLKTDIEDLALSRGNNRETYKVCANLPYYITTPVIFKLLESCPSLSTAILMVQREVAQRILAPPGGKEYGLLTVMANYYARWEMVSRVPATCFWPKPEVESALIRMTPLTFEQRVAVGNVDNFKKLVKIAFNQRRKMLANTLATGFDLDKEEVKQRLREAGIDEKARPEQLSLEQFGCLARHFFI